MELIYVNKIGMNTQNEIEYEFLFSDDSTMAWCDQWLIAPAGLCTPSEMLPHPSTYTKVLKVITPTLFGLAQCNTQFSFQDCIEGIIALAWDDINSLSTYPEKRIVFTYGESSESVENKLTERNILFFYTPIKV